MLRLSWLTNKQDPKWTAKPAAVRQARCLARRDQRVGPTGDRLIRIGGCKCRDAGATAAIPPAALIRGEALHKEWHGTNGAAAPLDQPCAV